MIKFLVRFAIIFMILVVSQELIRLLDVVDYAKLDIMFLAGFITCGLLDIIEPFFEKT